MIQSQNVPTLVRTMRFFLEISIKSLLTGTCFWVSSLWETGISTV